MPLYDFRCPDCGDFEALLLLSELEQPPFCPECGGEARRLVSVPRLALLSSGARRAHETNERSAHEPRLRQRHSCCGGGACSHQKTPAQARGAPKASSNKQARPWMLGH